MISRHNWFTTIVVIAGLPLTGSAFAYGGGGGGGGGGAGGSSGVGGAGGSSGGGILRSSTPHVCPRGHVLDQRRHVCVRARADVLPDSRLDGQGRAVAVGGYYEDALPIREAVTRGGDSMVDMMRGDAKRGSDISKKAWSLLKGPGH